MQKLFEILVLAVVQGIGEFLPISSSGHLVAVNDFFERWGSLPLEDQLMVSILLHLGTLFSVLVVFRKRILALLSADWRLIPLLIVGTIPAVIVGIPLEKYCKPLLESPLLTGCCFLGTALLLLRSSKIGRGSLLCRELTYRKALVIGLFQAVAILPGFSRSGFTIVGALFCKLRRDEAATFSFLLAIPVIGGSGLLETLKLLKHHEKVPSGDLAIFLLGMFVSFLVGLIALIWLLKWLQQGKLHLFAYWLLIIGPVLIVASLCFPLSEQSGAVAAVESVVAETIVAPAISAPKVEPAAVAGTESSSRQPANRESQPDGPSVQSQLQPEQQPEQLPEPTEEEEDDWEPETPEPPVLGQPLIDCPEERLISLDGRDPVWITRDRKSVVALGEICLREGLLEFFACVRGSKEHESIIAMNLKPFLLHAGLLIVGAEPGRPAQFSPEFVPPQGPKIDIQVLWRDEQGAIRQCRAQELVLENDEMFFNNENREDGGEETTADSTAAGVLPDAAVLNKPQEMSVPFVFTGSFFREFEDENGQMRQVYMADATGELFGVSNFPASILDVPMRSSDSNDELLFAPYTERIPPIGTPVTLILTPLAD